jgi:hypothetical protein
LEGTFQPPVSAKPESNVRAVQEIRAVKREEMNPVESAYFNRPGLPFYRIHTDQDVNGSSKAQNSIPEIHLDAVPAELDQKDSDLYCICRKPYQERDSLNQYMVQCDGPC